ncbi:MAG: guanylate kinase [Patescibacteria group bacterium]|nr:guanylate kinase [Patescibacteria group bacterium]
MDKLYPIIIISGPSGAGEDSIINALKERLDIERVLTTTTREKRPEESEGNPYYFLTKDKFEDLLAEDKMFEHAIQYDNYYGVTKEEIKRVRNSGKVGVLKLDLQGIQTLQKRGDKGFISIFVSAPVEQLEKRVRNRDGRSEEYIQDRMEYAKKWLKYKDIYDYQVENLDGKLDKAIEETEAIINNVLSLDKKGFIV